MKKRIQIYLVLIFGMILIPTQAYDRIDVFSGNGEPNNETNELICTDGTTDFAPTVTLQPTTQSICVSGDATFTIEATGNGTVTYQWQYWVNPTTYVSLSDAGVYSGTNTATLTITGADNTLPELAETDNSDGIVSAYFRCVVSDVDGSTTSGLTYLHIHTTPTVSSDPTDVTVCDNGSGTSATFSVTSSLTPAGLTYQWQVSSDGGSSYDNVTDGGVYSGATTKDLYLTGATSALSGNKYKCIIGNCSSPVESTAALLTIDDKAAISLHPVLTKVCEGSDATFTIEATGNGLIYQWQEAPAGTSSFVDIVNNATYFGSDGTLDITAAGMELDGKRYRCVVTSGSCTSNSASAVLTVYASQTLTPATPTNNLTVCEGGSTTFVVGRSGSGTPFSNGTMSYQWQSDNGIDVYTDVTDDAIYSGTTSNQLTISDATLSFDGMKYRCVIRGCAVDIPSTPETLTVNQLPLVTTSPSSQTICAYESATFSAEATGTGVSYLWYYSSDEGVNWNVATFASYYGSASMTVNNAPTSYNGYIFKCVASSASPCTITSESNPATLTVDETTISVHPEGATTCSGDNTTFSVTAVGNNLTYQWYEYGIAVADGGIYSGATTATLSITGAPVSLNGYYYYCIVSGNCSAATSNYSYLYVYGVDKPVIAADFSNATQPYLYVSNVSGDTYEWFLNGTSYSNASSLNVSDAGSYTVIVSLNSCPSEESDAQVIIVTDLDKDLLNGIKTYPNPVLDKLIIRLDRVIENTSIRVVDLNGKMKINQTANAMDNEVDMSDLAKGTYLVQVLNAEKTLTYKVIKE